MNRLVMAVSILFLAGVACGQELLTNPGFEYGDYTGWTTCGGQTLTSDQFTPVPHSGSYATQECGCCGDHDAGGGWQEFTSDHICEVGGWARTCSYGGASNTEIGYGGTACPAMDTVLGAPPSDCTWYQYTTTLPAGTIQLHYAWPDTGWGATCNAVDDMFVFPNAVDDWIFY